MPDPFLAVNQAPRYRQDKSQQGSITPISITYQRDGCYGITPVTRHQNGTDQQSCRCVPGLTPDV